MAVEVAVKEVVKVVVEKAEAMVVGGEKVVVGRVASKWWWRRWWRGWWRWWRRW